MCSFSFFLPFSVFHREISSQDRLGTTNRQLRRPLASPFLWGILHSRPRRASPSGYCAVVRTPLHSPTTDAAVPLAFSPPQPRLASSHFFLLAPQVLAPNAADHCLLQRAPGCSAPLAPAWFSNNGRLPYCCASAAGSHRSLC